MVLLDLYKHCPGDQQIVYSYNNGHVSVSRYKVAAEIAEDKHRNYIITNLFCANSVIYAKVVEPGGKY